MQNILVAHLRRVEKQIEKVKIAKNVPPHMKELFIRSWQKALERQVNLDVVKNFCMTERDIAILIQTLHQQHASNIKQYSKQY